jgi:hypothetical protein
MERTKIVVCAEHKVDSTHQATTLDVECRVGAVEHGSAGRAEHALVPDEPR